MKLDGLKIIIARNIRTGEWLLFCEDGKAYISTKDRKEIKATAISHQQAIDFMGQDVVVADEYFAACALMRHHGLFAVLSDMAVRCVASRAIRGTLLSIPHGEPKVLSDEERWAENATWSEFLNTLPEAEAEKLF